MSCSRCLTPRGRGSHSEYLSDLTVPTVIPSFRSGQHRRTVFNQENVKGLSFSILEKHRALTRV